jgi:pyocin large subunit-like protein
MNNNIINNKTELRARKGVANAVVSILGNSSINDGGSNTYYWNPTSTATDDNDTVIQVNNVSVGRWIQIPIQLGQIIKSQTANSIVVTNDAKKLSFLAPGVENSILKIVNAKPTFVPESIKLSDVANNAAFNAIVSANNYIGLVLVRVDSTNDNQPTLYLVVNNISIWIPSQLNA